MKKQTYTSFLNSLNFINLTVLSTLHFRVCCINTLASFIIINKTVLRVCGPTRLSLHTRFLVWSGTWNGPTIVQVLWVFPIWRFFSHSWLLFPGSVASQVVLGIPHPLLNQRKFCHQPPHLPRFLQHHWNPAILPLSLPCI